MSHGIIKEGENMTIGILDSGLGGYSIYHSLRAAYPQASFLFLADQKNAPFGDKTKAEIFEIACDAIEWFKTQDIKEILIACNTISAQVLSSIIPLYPELTLHGIIDPTVQQLNTQHFNNILVVATQGTILSKAYPKKLTKLLPESNVIGLALPQLVLQIEGLATQENVDAYLKEMCALYQNKIDALVLACTHYPLVQSSFERLFNVPIFDSVQPVIDLFSTQALQKGSCNVYTTKDPDYMAKQLKTLFNTEEIVKFTKVNHADRRR